MPVDNRNSVRIYSFKHIMSMDLEELYWSQQKTFGLARENYIRLKESVYRSIPINGFELKIQFNPSRILSTNAKVDPATIRNRKCFLCPENMPPEQEGLPYGERYKIFVNPYPIFEKHFTVPAIQHSPQLIDERFEDLLALAFDFPGYTVFYNGPECGASAPDHFHFQMAPRRVMPVEQDVNNDRIIKELIKADSFSVLTIDNYLRRILVLKSTDSQTLTDLFDTITALLPPAGDSGKESKFNLIAWFEDQTWTVCLFPRETLRPWQFFAEGDVKVLFSPGSVDMAGLIVAPRREDFEKYTPGLLTDLFSQVTLAPSAWERLKTSLIQTLNK